MTIELMENKLAEYRDAGATALAVETERDLLAQYEVLRGQGESRREKIKGQLLAPEFLDALIGVLDRLAPKAADDVTRLAA